MTKEITPIILAFGTGATLYAMSVRKEQPVTASITFSIIGATVALLTIGSTFRTMSPMGAIKTGQKLANTLNNAFKVGCPTCRR